MARVRDSHSSLLGTASRSLATAGRKPARSLPMLGEVVIVGEMGSNPRSNLRIAEKRPPGPRLLFTPRDNCQLDWTTIAAPASALELASDDNSESAVLSCLRVMTCHGAGI